MPLADDNISFATEMLIMLDTVSSSPRHLSRISAGQKSRA